MDIGCGSGDFVKEANSTGIEANGIDPFLPRDLECEELRRRTVESLDYSEKYDIITAFNVAEHLVYPTDFFSAIGRLLNRGGVLLLTCPFGDSLHRKIFKERWSLLSLDEHLLFWNVKSLDYCLRREGFSGMRYSRIGGSPFPIGRTPEESPKINKPIKVHDARIYGSNTTKSRFSAMSLIRFGQNNRLAAWLSRNVMNSTGIGNYLDFYAIR